MALWQAVANRVRSVCQTGGDGHPAVAHPTGLLAGSPPQPGQSSASGAARSWAPHGGPPGRVRGAGHPADHARYAFGLSHRETQTGSKHGAAAGGSTNAEKASATAQEQQASGSMSALARRQGLGNFQADEEGSHEGCSLNFMPLRATIKAPNPSTQPPSPLRNPGLRLRLMPSGHPQGMPLHVQESHQA